MGQLEVACAVLKPMVALEIAPESHLSEALSKPGCLEPDPRHLHLVKSVLELMASRPASKLG